MSLTHVLDTLLARRRLFLWIFGGVILTTLLLSLCWPKTYVAQSSVVVDLNSADPVSGAAPSPELMLSTMATQVDVIGSHNVARKVVERLHLSTLPTFKKKFERATHGAGSIDDWIADYLLKKVKVNPSHESQVIDIDVGYADPKMAADIANAFADAYIQTSLELKAEPARRQSQWFTEQMKNLRTRLEQAQVRLSNEQQSTGVLGTNEQIDIENTRLAELSSQLISAQATMYENENKRKQMERAIQLNKLDETPELSNNVLLQTLRVDLGRAEGRLAETAERFGLQHPQYVSAQAEVNALRRKLAAEIKTAGGTIGQAADVSARQQAELEKALNAQRDRVLQLKRSVDHINILRRDVESSQQAYDLGLQRSNQIHLASQLNQSSIAVLNPALSPAQPAKPDVLLNVLIAAVLGCILGLAAVIGIEGLDQRIRSGESLMTLTGLVILADIPRPRASTYDWRALKRWIPPWLLPPRQEALR